MTKKEEILVNAKALAEVILANNVKALEEVESLTIKEILKNKSSTEVEVAKDELPETLASIFIDGVSDLEEIKILNGDKELTNIEINN